MTRPIEMKISEKPRKNSNGSSSEGRRGAFAGAVVYQGLQRGGLRFAKNSGGDGGAKIFWGHSDGASARNGPFRDKGFVGANQVR
jgi:hypothetical protein